MARWYTKEHWESQRYVEGLAAEAIGTAPQFRKIDYVDARTRNKEMKVLCLGFSRTGTYSLTVAMQMLGYKPYHFAQLMENIDVDLPCWTEAVEQKYLGKGEYKPWGRDEFDKLLAFQDVVLDVPAILFAEELINAYPEAKIILSKRPVDGWVKSVRNTLGQWYGYPLWKYLKGWDPHFFDRWVDWQYVADDVIHFSDAYRSQEAPLARKSYLDHYEHMKKICPKDRLLELELGSGFDVLCPFLGVEDPGVPYPKVNNTEFLNRVHYVMIRGAMAKAAKKILTVGVPIFASAWWFRAPLKSYARSILG